MRTSSPCWARATLSLPHSRCISSQACKRRRNHPANQLQWTRSDRLKRHRAWKHIGQVSYTYTSCVCAPSVATASAKHQCVCAARARAASAALARALTTLKYTLKISLAVLIQNTCQGNVVLELGRVRCVRDDKRAMARRCEDDLEDRVLVNFGGDACEVTGADVWHVQQLT